MPSEFNVERTKFDLDTFQQILEAMDGYHILPWLKTSGQDDNKMIDVEPWELPDMPEVSVDAWRYHVGFAIDRGFIECWSPDPEDAVTVRLFSEAAQNGRRQPRRLGQLPDGLLLPPLQTCPSGFCSFGMGDAVHGQPAQN